MFPPYDMVTWIAAIYFTLVVRDTLIVLLG